VVRRQTMKRYAVEEISKSDIERMLSMRLGNLVEMSGSNARVIVNLDGQNRLIEIPTGFWRELKEAE